MNRSHIRSMVYLLVFVSALLFYKYGRSIWVPVYQRFSGKKTVEEIIRSYGAASRSRMQPYFMKAGIDYPPETIIMLALKKEKRLELWASDGRDYALIHQYEIVKMSGKSGPKLREGDRQVPEGIYEIVGLNPNSSYHLSMKLNYPNEFDLFHAKNEGRTQPGTNIFIHGKDVSIGCLAMGDETIEELFVLVHDVGRINTKVIISPHDPKKSPLLGALNSGPSWLPALYEDISRELEVFR